MKEKRQIAILGSTGSIGTQALEVIEEHSDLYEVYCLTANNKVELLAEQAHKFKPAAIVIANEQRYDELKRLMSDMPDVKVYAGRQALDEIVEAGPINMVLTAMVGFAGLSPTIHAIKAGKAIALANKETLVVAGELILQLAQQYHTPILPVDSEHSAIFQSLVGEDENPIEKILLTASGGPFRLKSMEEIAHVTKADALEAPDMGHGGEDRHRLGLDDEQGLRGDRGQVALRRRCQADTGAGASAVDRPQCRAVPRRLGEGPAGRARHAAAHPVCLLVPPAPAAERRAARPVQAPLEFFEPDLQKFRCLAMAYEAIDRGGNMPCIVNAANGIVNRAFLETVAASSRWATSSPRRCSAPPSTRLPTTTST